MFVIILALALISKISAAVSESTEIVIEFQDINVNLDGDVRYFLYTRDNPKDPQILQIDNKQVLQRSLYNSNKATKFVTHGWLNSYLKPSCVLVRKAFLIHDDYNVIVVDWSGIAKLTYGKAAGLAKAVGAHIARMINFLESEGTDLNSITLAGHSLGSHVMGLAGYHTTNKVGHIVGLDPAGPGFSTASPGYGISSEDAKLVEIIHTNVNVLGLARPAGHLDFFPNGGGPKQPGCEIELHNLCAHNRAFELYADSIVRAGELLGVSCSDHAAFLRSECNENPIIPFPGASGYGKTGNGLYFLFTAHRSPYGLGTGGTRPTR